MWVTHVLLLTGLKILLFLSLPHLGEFSHGLYVCLPVLRLQVHPATRACTLPVLPPVIARMFCCQGATVHTTWCFVGCLAAALADLSAASA